MKDNQKSNHKRHVKSRNSHLTIGFICNRLVNEYSCKMWAGVADAAREHEANLIYFSGGLLNDPYGYDAQANVLYERVNADTLDGLVIWGAQLAHFAGIEGVRNFCARYYPLPIVSIGLALEGIPSLVMNNYQGMYDVVMHLIEAHGCCRIAFLRKSDASPEMRDRYRAYIDALTAHGIPLDPYLVVSEDDVNTVLQRHPEISSQAAAIHVLLDERKLHPQRDFDAVLGRDDDVSLSALALLQERDIQVPDDVAVAGLDDLEEARYITPPLTTARQSFYGQGWQGVEMLLAKLRGEEVSEQVIMPMKLIVRQSCGCKDPAVAEVAVEPATGYPQAGASTFEVAFTARREEALSEMAQVGEAFVEKLFPGWTEHLLNSFAADVGGGSPGVFMASLEDILRRIVKAGGDVTALHRTLSELRRHTLSCMGTGEVLSRAENLWQQARFVIGDTAQRVQAHRKIQAAQQAVALREIGQALITTFDMTELMDVLAQELPSLGIPSCSLSLYENPKLPAEWARLMLAYDEEGRVEQKFDEQRIPPGRLVPEGLLPHNRQYSIVATPLYFREEQLGFVLFEMGPQEGTSYEALRGEISSALQGALLVWQVQEHADELAATYKEIQNLNEQLKEENLRMGMELDVARRLQQMILPKAEELEQIQGLEIVGFMQPADEVGGDYYDVLQEDGVIHIGIGDVTGHGLESGVLMLMTQTAIRTLIEHGETDPAAFLITLNRMIYKNAQRMDVDKSLTIVFVDYQEGQLKLVGQHEEVIVVRRGGQIERVDTVNLGFPIGLEDDISRFIHETTITLQSGDSMVLYTDGITEAENKEKEFYGIKRLCEVISQKWDKSAEEIKQAVIEDVTWHIGEQTIYDDLTLVVLKQL